MVERYPDGNKVPDALLKIGLGLENEGSAALAREVYDELVRPFPETAAAEAARPRLAGLGDAPNDPS